MPHTLRRKMFKLGGEVNSHGVGLTSGLSYNRSGYNGGGAVAVGSGNNPKIMGPDGRMREGHAYGTIASGIGRIFPWLWRHTAQPMKGIWSALRGRGGKDLKDYITGGRLSPEEILKRTRGKGLNPEEALRIYGRFGFGPQGRISQIARGINVPATALGPAALVSGAIPTMTEEQLADPNISDARKNWDRIRRGGEIFADLNPLMGTASLVGSGLDAAVRSFGEDPQYSIETVPGLMRKTIYGADKPGPANVPKTPPMEQAMVQEEEFAALKRDAEKRAQLYMDLLGEEPDKMGAISRGLIQAGQLWDEDRGAAIGALGTEAGAETQRIKDLEDQFRGMAVQEVVGGDLAQQQALDQAKIQLLSDPSLDPTMRSQGLKGIEAYEEGVTDVLPLNAKGDAADGSRLSEGSVYYDPTNLYGGMYVGVSSNPDDPDGQVQGFDSAKEARAHAAG